MPLNRSVLISAFGPVVAADSTEPIEPAHRAAPSFPARGLTPEAGACNRNFDGEGGIWKPKHPP